MRLTNNIRKVTLENAYTKLVQPRIDDVLKTIQAVAEKAAASLYSRSTQNWIHQAPEGGLVTRSNFKLGYDTDEGINHSFRHPLLQSYDAYSNNLRYGPHIFTLKKPIRLLARDHHRTSLDISDSKSLINKFQEAITELECIQTSADEAMATISSALNACSTDTKLKELYPELAEYLPKEHPTTKQVIVSNDLVRNALKSLAA